MKKYLLYVIILSLFSLVTVSAYMPIALVPPLDPDPLATSCNCEKGDTQACTDSNGCAGEQTCKSASCTIVSGCGHEDCSANRDDCESDCNTTFFDCMGDCGWDLDCWDACNDSYTECMDDCDDDYHSCNKCNGRWGACVKTVACCGVTCPSNKVCSAGSCVCADTTERCGPTGTGDGIDNDCDGQIDEICSECTPGASRVCNEGACAGTQTCRSNGVWGACSKTDPCCGVNCTSNKHCSAGTCVCSDIAERCGSTGTGDGIDNDCDGQIDESCNQCVAGATQSCNYTSSCPGTKTCTVAGAWGPCRIVDLCCGVTCASGMTCNSANGNCVPIGSAGTGTTGTGPSGTGSTSSKMAIDTNLVIILVMVIVVIIAVLVAIKMLVGKKQPPAPPQPPVYAQYPQYPPQPPR